MALVLLHKSFIHSEFDKNRTFACNLHIYYRHNRFAYMVTNMAKDTCLLFKEFRVDGSQPFLHDLALEHEEISRFYRSADVLFGDLPFTLVPTPLFAEKDADDYYRLSNRHESSQQVVSSSFEQTNITSLISLDAELWKHFKSFFQSFRVMNEGTVLYDWLLSFARGEEAVAGIMLYQDHFIMALKKDGQLQLANRFPKAGNEELLYFVANSCEQLSIDPANLSLYMAGDVENLSALLGFINPYVHRAEPLHLTDAFDISVVTEPALFSRYFTLLQSSQCAL